MRGFEPPEDFSLLLLSSVFRYRESKTNESVTTKLPYFRKKTEEQVTPFLRIRRGFKKKRTYYTHFQHFYDCARVVNVGVVLRVIFPLLSFIYFLISSKRREE